MKDPIKHFGFNAENYKWLFIGLAINILGYILMIGGGSDDPNKFDGSELFSNTRITISPILIVVGYIIIFYAVMKRGSGKSSDAATPEEADLTKKSK